MAAVYAIAIVR